MELFQASRQWASRPSDERFTSLTDLLARCDTERARSASKVVSTRQIECRPVEADGIKSLELVSKQNGAAAAPTHWAFGQLSELAGAPAGYLRKLPAPIAADAINYGLRFLREPEDMGLLLTKGFTAPENGTLPSLAARAATGPRYGRIWNNDVVRSLVDRFGDGVTGDFKVPGEFGKDVPITKNNTTIYGSDRDIFIFLADEHNRVHMNNRRDGKSGSLARGFFVWNSEVGSGSIGAAFFLFDYACSNRIVWGAKEYREIRLRHSVSAPDRWLEQITPVLIEYSNSAAAPVEAALKSAQERKLDDVKSFLRGRFSAGLTEQIITAHAREEGRPVETLWDAVTGLTAHAKTLSFSDHRVDLERKAGAMLDLVA